jgi:hypothetical protein
MVELAEANILVLADELYILHVWLFALRTDNAQEEMTEHEYMQIRAANAGMVMRVELMGDIAELTS